MQASLSACLFRSCGCGLYLLEGHDGLVGYRAIGHHNGCPYRRGSTRQIQELFE